MKRNNSEYSERFCLEHLHCLIAPTRSVSECVNFTHWGPFFNPSRPFFLHDGLPVSTCVVEGKTRFILSNDDSFNTIFLSVGQLVECYVVHPKSIPQCDKAPRVVRGARIHMLSQELQTLFALFGSLTKLKAYGCNASAGVLDFRMMQLFSSDVNQEQPLDYTPSTPSTPLSFIAFSYSKKIPIVLIS